MIRDTYLKYFYRSTISILAAAILWQCNIEVGNPDSNLPESMASVQNLSFNLAVGGSCVTTSEPCTSAPVVLPDAQFSGIYYEITAANFQLSGLQLKPSAENPLWTQLYLLRGSSVVLSEYTDPASVTGIALKFEPAPSPGARSFEITGNLVLGASDSRLVLPLKLVFDGTVLAETPVSTPGAVLDGVEFDASAWFNFSDAKVDVRYIFKNIASGACRLPDSPTCTSYREIIARQVSRRISRSMTVKSHPAGKTSQQKTKSP